MVNHLSLTEESINLLRAFDWMMYEAFLTCLYGKVDWSNLKDYNVQRYIEELKKWHSKNYLKWQPKINYVKEYILRENLDVLFLQEAGHEKLESSISTNYICFRSEEAMIIVKKNIIVEDPQVSKFHLLYGSRLNFNHDSHYVKLKNHLLCCIHLSSKSANQKQAKEMADIFKEIRNEYENLNIIAGVDANHFLEDFPFLNVYPSDELDVTTRKKRTSMQLQFEKAEKLIEEAKDHIITNLSITDVKVETINCDTVINDLLPNENHPYDHFAVFAIIRKFKKGEEEDDNNDEDELSIDEDVRNRNTSFATTNPPEDDLFNMRKSEMASHPQLAPRESERTHSTFDLSYNNAESSERHHNSERPGLLGGKRYMGQIMTKQHNETMKPETLNRIQQTRPNQVYYNQAESSKREDVFLQFSKTPKQGSSSTRNKSRAHEESTQTTGSFVSKSPPEALFRSQKDR